MSTSVRSIRVSEPLVLAGLPVTGYACAFLYEVGFAQRYGIPLGLIEIGLTDVVIVTFILLGAALLLTSWLLFIPKGPWLSMIRRVFPLFGSLFVVWAIRSPGLFGRDRYLPLYIWGPVFVLILLLIVIGVVQPFIKYQGSVSERWRQSDEADATAHPETAWFSVLDRAVDAGVDLRSWLRVYWFLFFAFFVSYNTGKLYSARQIEFLVAGDAKPFVVLRKYGENFICEPLDTSTKTVQRTIWIVPVRSDSVTRYRQSQIGPLVVAPVQ